MNPQRSNDHRPQSGVTVAHEMNDVRRCHENRIAGLTDRDGTGGEDGVGI
jgi:hypothetical protein